jgi:PAS domain S-box-containing protein
VIRGFILRRTLEQRFAATLALLAIVLVGTTMFVVRSQVALTLRSGLEARGYSIARSIGAVATPSLLAYNYAALQIAAEGASADPGVLYVIIHDKEGVVAGAAGSVAAKAGASTRPATSRDPVSLDRSIADGPKHKERVLEVQVPVLVEGVEETWGTVRVGLSYEPAEAELGRIMLHLIGLGAALSVAAIGIGRFMAARIAAPLRQLVEGTEALSAGDMGHRIPAKGPKELRDLARSFNVMMDRVQEKAKESAEFQGALERLNARLEEQVRERTLALEESVAQYKTLVEHSPDSILIVQEERVRFVNRAFTETFGVTENEVLGDAFDLSRVFDTSSEALARGNIRAWERGEASTPIEILGKDASGRVRHLELRGSRIEFQGRPAAECLLVDMTEAKRLTERLNSTEKLRALGELAGGVAHDFNNLLGAILGRVQLLRRQAFDPKVDRELAVIEKAAQDGGETVRRIQEFSRIRRDRRFAAVDLAEVLRDTVDITKTRWKTEAERRNVAVQVVLDTRPVPPVLGNASELREVFTNLVLNAVDAMPQGGKLHLSCRHEGDVVTAEVRDTGVGMTEAIQKNLFDPFFTTKGSRGMGLGMSVVYGIVTRHEGKIDVSSALGKGTTFTLEFPKSNQPIAVAGGDGAAMPTTLRKGRILVIDDEPEVAAVVKDVLTASGHTVDAAFSAADGIQLASVSTYDAVFTDLGMPDMSGWEVAARIHELHPDLPVALVTGWGTSLDEDDARRRGIRAVVHKPFEIDEITRAASEILG